MKKEKFCGSNDVDSVAWHWENSGKKPTQVGTKQPNGLGLYDMSGNVEEWVGDLYNNYSSSPKDNPKPASSSVERLARNSPRPGRQPALSAATVGTTTRGTHARLTASGAGRLTATTAWASGLSCSQASRPETQASNTATGSCDRSSG